MIKLSETGKDLIEGIPRKTTKNFLKTLLNKEEILEIKKNEMNQNFDLIHFFNNIESSIDLNIFIISIYKDVRLNVKEESELEIRNKIYQNIFNILNF